MPNEPVRVVFHLNQDSRLVGVLCSAIQFQALQAGLGTEAVEQLAKAAVGEGVAQEGEGGGPGHPAGIGGGQQERGGGKGSEPERGGVRDA